VAEIPLTSRITQNKTANMTHIREGRGDRKSSKEKGDQTQKQRMTTIAAITEKKPSLW
jgi:hypothetical protein